MTTPALQRTSAEAAYLADYSAGAGWLGKQRQRGFDAFAPTGLPHRRLEDWKWTDLRRLIDDEFPPSAGGPVGDIDALVASSPLSEIARARLVFVNGNYDVERSSLPASGGVTVTSLGETDAAVALALREGDPLDALNLANVSDGAVITIASGTNADAPIELVFVCSGAGATTYSTRNVIALQENATATVFETHLGGNDPYVTNSVTEVTLAAGARLDRVKLQIDESDAFHLSNLIASLGDSARLQDFTLTTGASVTRQQGFISFDGEHAEASVSGAYLLAGEQHADTRLVVDHRVPNCTSRELFKCVMDDRSRGIFQGKVIVQPDAQKTDGKQSSHALLLSSDAEFDAKPELEIYADDVVCGHGATSGELEEDHLFYLRARGIPEAKAKSMLIAAFAAEAFDDVASDAVREALAGLAENWLEARG